MTKTYLELIEIPSFEERVKYLQLNSSVGSDTFGFDRYLNQNFYRSTEWKRIRNQIIIRDNGCDLAHPERPILGRVLIHHINPVSIDDFLNFSEALIDLNNLISVSHETHNLIHYGIAVPKEFVERKPGDTCPWKIHI